ncbi:MAG: cupin domain-containing protein [Pseudomonadales bacterium]|nr:cupin domain-containing protein [Pseudomonadales bacterium]
MPNKTAVENLIESLALEPHIEGGFFKRTFSSDQQLQLEIGDRAAMSSIYYLLTAQENKGYWHKNRSDIMHYFHAGSPLNYFLISPDGELQAHVLSNGISCGKPQLFVPAGYWKATVLEHGDYGLLSEAVCPGFDYQDMELGDQAHLIALFPQHSQLIKRFSR